MSEEVTKMPAVSPDEPASDKQEKMLRELKKWKDGMTKDEATKIISEHIADAQMEPGVRLLKIDSIEQALDSSGKPITDKDGNPALRITFRAKPLKEGMASKKIADLFFYPKTNDAVCRSAFKYRNLKKAMDLKPEEEQSAQAVKNLTIWGIVREVHFIDESGNPIVDKEGKPETTVELLPEYVNGKMGMPNIAGDPNNPHGNGKCEGKFYTTRVKRVKTQTSEDAGDPAHSDAPEGAAPAANDDWA